MPLEYIRVFLMVNLTAKLLPASLGSFLNFTSMHSVSHFTTYGRKEKCTTSPARAKPEEFGIIPGLFSITWEMRLKPKQQTSSGQCRRTNLTYYFLLLAHLSESHSADVLVHLAIGELAALTPSRAGQK